VRQLIDQRHLGAASKHRVEIHLLKDAASVLDGFAWHHLKVGDQFFSKRASVTFYEPYDDVSPALLASVALVQHGKGLAHPGGGAKVKPEMSGWFDVVSTV
jgi:hypothetical protein